MTNYKKIRKTVINIIQYLVFLSLGIFLFLRVTDGFKIQELFDLLLNYDIKYMVFAIFISVLSNVSRAIRWNMIINPMGYKVKLFNTFVSVNIMYLANFFVPRAGEIARCGILAKTDHVPFAKLVGTVIVERIADVIILLFLAIIVVFTQTKTIKDFFENNMGESNGFPEFLTTTNIIIFLVAILAVFVLLFLYRKKFKDNVIYKKLAGFYHSLVEGVKAIFKLEKPIFFILHTIFIFSMWFVMLYTFLMGFGPTKGLGMAPVLTIFVMSSLAMIVPVPAGMGAYHYTVASALVLYGLDFKTGVSFAFITHTSVNLYLDILGLIGFLYVLYLIFIKSRNNAGTE